VIQTDRQIAEYVRTLNMIEPFEPGQIRQYHPCGQDGLEPRGVISYGLSSFGYDCRTSEEFKVIRPFPVEPNEALTMRDNGLWVTSDGKFFYGNQILDPKDIDPRFYHSVPVQDDPRRGKFIVLAPGAYCLSHSIEYFRIPANVTVVCVGKSTYARAGLVVNVTPLESGWEGQVTLEFTNCTPVPIRVYANEGICQFKFMAGLLPDVTYASRNGKYQHQTGITLPKL